MKYTVNRLISVFCILTLMAAFLISRPLLSRAATYQIVDECSDFSKMHEYSPTISLTTGTPLKYGGDNTRIHQGTPSTEKYIIYKSSAGDFTSLLANVYVYSYAYIHGRAGIDFYISANGVDYAAFTPTRTVIPNTYDTGWPLYKYESTSIPAGTKFIKVVIPGRTEGYSWEVQLSKIVLTSAEAAEDTTAPGNVTNIAVTTGGGKLTFTWADPTDTDLKNIVISGEGQTIIESVYANKGSQTVEINGLTNGALYTFRIKSVDVTGNASTGVLASGTPQAPADTTAPGNVTNITVTPGNGRLTLAWADPTDSDLKNIVISGEGQTVIESVYANKGSQSAVISGLTNGTSYTFRIKSVDLVGNISAGVLASGTPKADAVPGSVIEITKATSPIAIDGVIDSQWSNHTSIYLDKSKRVKGTGGDTITANIYFSWDDKNLYVGARIKEPTPMKNSNTGSGIWNGDALEIFVGPENIDQGGVLQPKDTQILLSGGVVTGVYQYYWANGAVKQTQLPMVVVRDADAQGYTLEAAIPFEGLNIMEPWNNPAFRFDVVLDDGTSAGRQRQWAWFGTDQNSSTRDKWGKAQLVGGVVPPEEISVVASVDSVSRQVTVSGATYKGAGKYVTVMVMNPSGKIDYMDQKLSGSNGSYTFNYTLDEVAGGEYRVKVGGKDISYPGVTTFDYAGITDTTPPENVTNAAVTTGNGKLTLTWTDPTDTDLKKIMIVGEGQTVLQAVYANKGSQSIVINGLMNGTWYDLRIMAMDLAGNVSSGVVVSGKPEAPIDVTPPGEVTNAAVIASNGKLTLTWTDPADTDLKNIMIIGEGQTVIQSVIVNKGSQTVVIRGLTNGTTYDLRIKAVDLAGNTSSGVLLSGRPEATEDKRALNEAIVLAESKYNSAQPGTSVGQYPQAAMDSLQAAILSAKAVASNDYATQAQIDASASALHQAMIVFEQSKITPSFTVEQPQFTNLTGETVTTLTGNGFIMANVKITSNITSSAHATLIIALFDSNNTLVNISLADKEMAAGEMAILKAGFKLPQNVDNYHIKVFVWDGLETKRALSDETVFPN